MDNRYTDSAKNAWKFAAKEAAKSAMRFAKSSSAKEDSVVMTTSHLVHVR